MTTGGIDLDATRFDKSIREFAAGSGIHADVVFNNQMGSLVDTMVKWEPPPSLAAGRRTVETDLLRLFNPYKNAKQLVNLHRDASSSKEGAAFRTKGGKVYAIDLGHIDVQGVNIASTHARYRDKRGRVRRKIGVKFAVPRSALRAYTRKQQDKVGFVKAGWAPAVRMFSNKTLPSFVSRHNNGYGEAINKLSGSAATRLTGYLEIANRTPYIRDEGRLRRALALREKDLEKNLQKRIDKLARDASAKAA